MPSMTAYKYFKIAKSDIKAFGINKTTSTNLAGCTKLKQHQSSHCIINICLDTMHM